MITINGLNKMPQINFRLDSILSKVLLLISGLIVTTLLYVFFLRPVELKLEKKLNYYPTQWSHVAQLSKTIEQTSGENTFFPFLNEQEFEVLRTKFTSLGMRPNIFRLVNSNEPKIEIQINEVDFATWLHLLDDLRLKYHLYTEAATIQKGSDSGTVQVSVTLVQKR
jgi:type II secretory pathway component PulM